LVHGTLLFADAGKGGITDAERGVLIHAFSDLSNL
jgi:hypothetical protein